MKARFSGENSRWVEFLSEIRDNDEDPHGHISELRNSPNQIQVPTNFENLEFLTLPNNVAVCIFLTIYADKKLCKNSYNII